MFSEEIDEEDGEEEIDKNYRSTNTNESVAINYMSNQRSFVEWVAKKENITSQDELCKVWT